MHDRTSEARADEATIKSCTRSHSLQSISLRDFQGVGAWGAGAAVGGSRGCGVAEVKWVLVLLLFGGGKGVVLDEEGASDGLAFARRRTER